MGTEAEMISISLAASARTGPSHRARHRFAEPGEKPAHPCSRIGAETQGRQEIQNRQMSKKPVPGGHGAKFGRDEASMIDTTSSPWKKSSDYGVQWPNLITIVWRIKM
jgi:hypothetical protein